MGKRKIGKGKDVNLCPFAWLRQYVTMRKSKVRQEEQFFVFRDR